MYVSSSPPHDRVQCTVQEKTSYTGDIEDVASHTLHSAITPCHLDFVLVALARFRRVEVHAVLSTLPLSRLKRSLVCSRVDSVFSIGLGLSFFRLAHNFPALHIDAGELVRLFM